MDVVCRIGFQGILQQFMKDKGQFRTSEVRLLAIDKHTLLRGNVNSAALKVLGVVRADPASQNTGHIHEVRVGSYV